MRLLSLYYGHDANLTLLEDGEVVVLLEKERLTRRKHDQGPMELDPILAAYGWRPDTIDLVVINPYLRPARDGAPFAWELEGERYDQRPDYKQDGWSGPPEGRMSRHRIRLFGRWIDAYAVDHHLAHVAGALFTSPFEEAGVLTADGSGDLRACALAWGGGHRIHAIEYGWGYEKKKMQLNIGAVWASLGEYNFGMKRLEGAGKLMGRRRSWRCCGSRCSTTPTPPFRPSASAGAMSSPSTPRTASPRMCAPPCSSSPPISTWRRRRVSRPGSRSSGSS